MRREYRSEIEQFQKIFISTSLHSNLLESAIMFIEITDPAGYGGFKCGDIVDVDEAVARAYISVGKAKESTEVARTLRAEMANEQKRTADMLDAKFKELSDRLAATVTSNGPPSRGMTFDKEGNVVKPADNGVDVGDGSQVRGSEAGADRGHQSFSEILNLIWRQKTSTESTEREWTATRSRGRTRNSRSRPPAGRRRRPGRACGGGCNAESPAKPRVPSPARAHERPPARVRRR
jgi:hypothetical protein